MKTFFSFLLISLLLSCATVYSQAPRINMDYTVIATSGVSIRANPSLKGKSLFALPYGSKVRIIDSKKELLDTIGGHHYYYGSDGKASFAPIVGYWVKIKYKDSVGYLFSAYLKLGDQPELPQHHTHLNQDYALLFPGKWCNENFWYQPNLYWYGLYQKAGKLHIRSVKPQFFYNNIVDAFTNIGITSNDNEGLLCIIGTKSPLQEGERIGNYSDNWHLNDFDTYKELILDTNKKEDTILMLEAEGKRQLLSPDGSEGRNLLKPSGVIWKGDLDGDGKMDYIIHYGEKGAASILYLSAVAGAKEIVKPVAIFYSGYCC